jgi:hypothetical protein
MSCSSTTNLEKASARQGDAKLKEFKREGWKITGTSKSLEFATLEHLEKLKNDANKEITAEVSMCRSANVCRSNALNNALIEYASSAGSYVRGRITSEMFNNASGTVPEEFDKFYAAYERLVSSEIKGELAFSFAVEKENGAGKSYRAYYIVNEDNAGKVRLRAMQQAFEESKMAQQYATAVANFVSEGFEK